MANQEEGEEEDGGRRRHWRERIIAPLGITESAFIVEA
jgi:hypothetical protein